jgi:alkanesulfonate monooxygenase SsuD/methylene tetrahydromethanopterin reductase-like flavin-dependent oxidoreductase (luciferase family)
MNARLPVLMNVARPREEADPVAIAERALAAGLDGIGIADSPRLFPDALIETERVLSSTDSSLAGPCVLSMGLRHPVTVGNAIATLEAHHPGRVLAVVGRGESSVRNEGMSPPTLRDYEQSLDRLHQHLTEQATPTQLIGAASGPQTISMTARTLHGVMIDVGADLGILHKAVDVARKASPAASIWVFVRVTLTDTDAAAAAAALPLLGSCATRLLAAPEWYGVPAEELAAIADVAAAHDYRRHGTAAARLGGSVSQESDALVRERFIVTGGRRQCEDYMRGLAEIGVDGLMLAGGLEGVLDRLEELTSAIRTGFSDQPALDLGAGGHR